MIILLNSIGVSTIFIEKNSSVFSFPPLWIVELANGLKKILAQRKNKTNLKNGRGTDPGFI
jgi:hypothetical protein